MVDYESVEHETGAPRFGIRSFLSRDWPYLLMLILALIGVAFTSIYQGAMTIYWVICVPLFGVITVASHWREIDGAQAHWQLVLTQALHWAAVTFAMYLVFVADVEKMMNSDASGLMVLTVLALGTTTAGIHAWAWRIVLVGAILGAGVPAVAWLEQSTLLILLAAVALASIAALVFLHNPMGVRSGRNR